ncbi:hypothetical protein D3C75_1146230 [compost metagenome]
MTRQVVFIVSTQVTGDVTRRNPKAAHTSQEGMGVVLAHPASARKRLGGGGVHRSRARVVEQVVSQAVHQIDQRRSITPDTAVLSGKGNERVIGLGQVTGT